MNQLQTKADQYMSECSKKHGTKLIKCIHSPQMATVVTKILISPDYQCPICDSNLVQISCYKVAKDEYKYSFYGCHEFPRCDWSNIELPEPKKKDML